MSFKIKVLAALVLLGFSATSFAESTTKTHRIQMLSNPKVTVWETIIYPKQTEKLAMHRHDKDRVLVALTDGVLKITDDKGQSHLFKFAKNQAYFLPAEPTGVLHTDENMGKEPIKVMLINLN